MSKITKLFTAPNDFEVRNDCSGWVIYSLYADKKAVEWLEALEQSKVYQRLDGAVGFFGLAGINRFTESLEL